MFYQNSDNLEKVLEGIGTWKMKTDREEAIEKRASKRKNKKKFDNGGEMLRLINTISGFTDGYQSSVLTGGGISNYATKKFLDATISTKTRTRSHVNSLLKNLGL